MKTIIELKAELAELNTQLKQYRDKESLSTAESKKANDLMDQMEGLQAQISLHESDTGQRQASLEPYRQHASKPGDQYRPRQGYTSYRDLFGSTLSNDGFNSFGEFVGAIMAGGGDRRLRWLGADDKAVEVVGSKRAMKESQPSAGGFLVPDEFAADLIDVGIEDSIVMPRAQIWPMKSNVLKIPGFEIGSHADNLYGGIICYWEAEAASLTETHPKARLVELTASKLTAYTYASNELRSDAPNYEARLSGAISKAIGWHLDRSMIDSGSHGDGSGKCQSYLNAPALVVVEKESGQTVDTIVYQNLVSMLSRMWAPGFMRSVWIANQNCIPELMQLVVVAGAGGTHVRVLNENNGNFTIFGRPCLFTEKCPSIGDQGDISLVDLSQYAIGLRGSLQLAVSGHARFQTDESVWRAILRADAQSTWDEALTPYKGSTMSPFVTLAERT